MSRKPPARSMLGWFEILVPLAIGLWVVGRTVLFYWPSDPLSAGLVGGMGAVFVLGFAELMTRLRGASLLAADVASLPPQLDDQGLTRLRPVLRDLLRARIEHAPAPFRVESITPFLVGLLVMLGLLGTLLGLFETLGGAGRALTSSTSIDTLRAALSGPMRGLTRSFGCSAAGVSASAMLGLAAALVRRREGKALAAVYQYASGPLRHLSPVRAQLHTLEQLARQGEALPVAAHALEALAQKLDHALHQTIEAAFSSLRSELTEVARATGGALQDNVRAQLSALAHGTSQALAEHGQHTARMIEHELRTRRDEDAALRAAYQDAVARIPDQLLQVVREHAGQVSASANQTSQAIAQQFLLLRDQAETQLTLLRQSADTLVTQLQNDTEQRSQVAGERYAALADRLHEVGDAVTTLTAEVSGELQARRALEHEIAAQTQNAMAQLAQSAHALDEALRRQDQAALALTEQASEQLARVAARSEAHAAAAVTQVTALAEAQTERFARWAGELEAAQGQHAERLAQELFVHAERLTSELESTGTVVREAADLWKASSVEMAAVAEMFAQSVDRQRDAASRWLESLGEVEDAVDRAGKNAAADALSDQLASTQEVFARQLQFQRELFEQLRSMRGTAMPSIHGEQDVSA